MPKAGMFLFSSHQKSKTFQNTTEHYLSKTWLAHNLQENIMFTLKASKRRSHKRSVMVRVAEQHVFKVTFSVAQRRETVKLLAHTGAYCPVFERSGGGFLYLASVKFSKHNHTGLHLHNIPQKQLILTTQ